MSPPLITIELTFWVAAAVLVVILSSSYFVARLALDGKELFFAILDALKLLRRILWEFHS
jgi:hypothetical protein